MWHHIRASTIAICSVCQLLFAKPNFLFYVGGLNYVAQYLRWIIFQISIIYLCNLLVGAIYTFLHLSYQKLIIKKMMEAELGQ